MAKSIKLNLFYNILLNVSNIIFPFITAPYIARVLEPDGIGLYNFAYTVAGYFAMVACLGVPTYGIRIVGANRDEFNMLNKVFCEVFSILVYMTLFLSIIFVVSTMLVSQFHEHWAIFLISGFALYVVPFKVDWFFSGLQQFGYIAARSIIIKTIAVLSLFIFVHDKNDLIYYVSISAFSIVANEIWNFIKLLNIGIKLKFVVAGCKQHLKPIIILASSFIATTIYTSLGTVILGFIDSYSEVGFYNSAANICKVAVPVVTSLATVALPQIANYLHNEKLNDVNELINKSISLTLFMAIPLTSILLVIAPDFVPLFFGEKFIQSVVPMQILAFLPTIVGLNNITGIQILIGLGKDKEFLKYVVISAVLSVVAYLAFVPLWGAKGAACGTLLAELLILVISYIYIKKTSNIEFHVQKDFILTVISSVSLIVVYILCKFFMGGWLLVIIGSGLGVLVYTLVQYLCGNKTMLIAKSALLRKVKL